MSILFVPITDCEINHSRIIRIIEDFDANEINYIASGKNAGIFVMKQKADTEELKYHFKISLVRYIHNLENDETKKYVQVLRFHFNEKFKEENYEEISKDFITALKIDTLKDNLTFLSEICFLMKTQFPQIDIIDLEIGFVKIEEQIQKVDGKIETKDTTTFFEIIDKKIPETILERHIVTKHKEYQKSEENEFEENRKLEIHETVDVEIAETIFAGENAPETEKIHKLENAEFEENQKLEIYKIEKLPKLNNGEEIQMLNDAEIGKIQKLKDDENDKVRNLEDNKNEQIFGTNEDEKKLEIENDGHQHSGDVETLEYQKELDEAMKILNESGNLGVKADRIFTTRKVRIVSGSYSENEINLDFEAEKDRESEKNGNEEILESVADDVENFAFDYGQNGNAVEILDFENEDDTIDEILQIWDVKKDEEHQIVGMDATDFAHYFNDNVPEQNEVLNPIQESLESVQVFQTMDSEKPEIAIQFETSEQDNSKLEETIKAQKLAVIKELEKKCAIEKQNSLKTIQEYLETVYPNSLTMKMIIEFFPSKDSETIKEFLTELEEEKIVTRVGNNEFIRSEISLIQNLKFKNVNHLKPTIAIITTLFMEKLAIDAIFENPYIEHQYNNANDSHVYTIGKIGKHVVVSTKLSMNNESMKSKIAANSMTTRLLGHFSSVEHVFILGTGVSIDHENVKIGDVVISQSDENKAYCLAEIVDQHENDDEIVKLITKYRNPKKNSIAEIISQFTEEDGERWKDQFDVLIQKMDDGSHQITNSSELPTEFAWHLGHIGTFCHIWQKFNQKIEKLELEEDSETAYQKGTNLHDQMFAFQQEFVQENNICAMDAGYESVISAIEGSCIYSWVIILGIFTQDDNEKCFAVAKAASFLKNTIRKL